MSPLAGDAEGALLAIAIVEARLRGDVEGGVLLRHNAADGQVAASAVGLATALALMAGGGAEGALELLARLRESGLRHEYGGPEAD